MRLKTAIITSLLTLISIVVGGQPKESVSILGDSYSTFQGYLHPASNLIWYNSGKHDNTDVTRVEETWWHILIKENGYKLCVNNSFSGSTICNTGYGGEDYSDRSFCTRLTDLGCPDVILICGGTNDSWADSPIGEYKYEDITPADLYYFRPAMAYMLEQSIAHYPNVDIYFILNDGLSDDITESCKTVCDHYGIVCVSLSSIDKINAHPSVEGMKQIAEQVAAAIKPITESKTGHKRAPKRLNGRGKRHR